METSRSNYSPETNSRQQNSQINSALEHECYTTGTPIQAVPTFTRAYWVFADHQFFAPAPVGLATSSQLPPTVISCRVLSEDAISLPRNAGASFPADVLADGDVHVGLGVDTGPDGFASRAIDVGYDGYAGYAQAYMAPCEDSDRLQQYDTIRYDRRRLQRGLES